MRSLILAAEDENPFFNWRVLNLRDRERLPQPQQNPAAVRGNQIGQRVYIECPAPHFVTGSGNARDIDARTEAVHASKPQGRALWHGRQGGISAAIAW